MRRRGNKADTGFIAASLGGTIHVFHFFQEKWPETTRSRNQFVELVCSSNAFSNLIYLLWYVPTMYMQPGTIEKCKKVIQFFSTKIKERRGTKFKKSIIVLVILSIVLILSHLRSFFLMQKLFHFLHFCTYVCQQQVVNAFLATKKYIPTAKLRVLVQNFRFSNKYDVCFSGLKLENLASARISS